MGETTSIDERGRITIPSEIRRNISKTKFNIQLVDKNTIILKAITNNDTLQKIKQIKLQGDPQTHETDFSTVKDKYGAIKRETP